LNFHFQKIDSTDSQKSRAQVKEEQRRQRGERERPELQCKHNHWQHERHALLRGRENKILAWILSKILIYKLTP
jgi:hypothetical protein